MLLGAAVADRLGAAPLLRMGYEGGRCAGRRADAAIVRSATGPSISAAGGGGLLRAATVPSISAAGGGGPFKAATGPSISAAVGPLLCQVFLRLAAADHVRPLLCQVFLRRTISGRYWEGVGTASWPRRRQLLPATMDASGLCWYLAGGGPCKPRWMPAACADAKPAAAPASRNACKRHARFPRRRHLLPSIMDACGLP